jgi:prepilin-type N-terminal cleavage/methylation domain-containing protein
MLKNRLRTAATTDESGFTLIELLIVIVVLGILAGIVVFGVGTFKADAEASACNTDKKTTSVAAEAFLAKTGAAPANVAALTGGGYLKAAPTNFVVTGFAANGDPIGACA